MENQYVTQPPMPVSFDPARYLRQPGRTQVATLVAASFFGCLLALLVVYGLIPGNKGDGRNADKRRTKRHQY